MYGPWLTENSQLECQVTEWLGKNEDSKQTNKIPFREWNLNGRHVLDTLLMLAEPDLCCGIHKND